ncbi:MAG: DinB family protein [Anaerolineales bacterium]|jgi:hypothetical protein
MNQKEVIQSQYHAALAMFRQAVEKCPDDLWLDPAYKNRSWNIAYHALVYTHFYLHKNEESFVPWPKHRQEARYFDMGDGEEAEPFTRAEVLEFIEYVEAQIDGLVDALDLEGESGFYWLPFNKLELQFYNIRHLMLHTGELAERVWQAAGEEVGWVGKRAKGD